MTSLQMRINGINALQKTIAAKEGELTKLKDELGLRTGQLRAKVAKGSTTGDRLCDLVVCAGGGINDPTLPKLSELQERLKDKKGDFVMIRYPVDVRERFGGDLRSGDFQHETHFRVSILAGEELRLGTGFGGWPVITLPVTKYIHGIWPEFHAHRAFLVDKFPRDPAGEDFLEWRRGDEPPTLLRYLQNDDYTYKLIIGDEAFLAELKKVGGEDFFKVAAEKLGRLILEPTGG